MIWNVLERYRDVGLWFLRLGTGLYIAFGHGWGKISGGPETWSQIGDAMELFGIGFVPVFWGFMSAVAEFIGGLCVAAGFLFRPALVLLVINLAVAATMHVTTGQGSPERALIYGIVFLSLLFIGPGPYSLDIRLKSRR